MKIRLLLLLLIIYLAFVALGLPDALMGSAWNLVREEMNVQLGAIGFVTIIAYFMTMLSTSFAPRLLRHIDTKWVTFVSIILTGSSLLLISQMTQFYQMVFLAIPLGVGAGAIDLSLNHYVAIHYKASHMSYLHSFYGLGVTIGPSIMAYTLRDNSWRIGYVIVGLVLLAIALLVFLSFPLWESETQTEKEERHDPVPFKETIRTKGVKHSLSIFLIYVHIESLAGVYIASYYFLIKHVSYAEAALFTTIYYLGLFLGRVLSGIFSDTLHPNTLIRIGEGFMVLAGLMMFINSSSLWIYYVTVGLLGLGSGPVFPNMMYMNPKNFDQRKMSRIMSLQMAIGYVGFGALTPFMGLLFQETTIAIYPIVITIWSVVLFLITYQFISFKLSTK